MVMAPQHTFRGLQLATNKFITLKKNNLHRIREDKSHMRNIVDGPQGHSNVV